MAAEKKILTHDYDKEAKKLFKSLGVNPKETSLSPIWRHPTTNGTIFVGSQSAAKSTAIQQKHGITHVVNCTSDMPMYVEHVDGMHCYRFDINTWLWNCEKKIKSRTATLWALHTLPETEINDVLDDLQEFTGNLFAFMDTALTSGNSVLVHCLAGAHRAGTTGVTCLMHYHGKLEDHLDALRFARKCRPIISPLGALVVFLQIYERLLIRKRANVAALPLH